MSAISSVMRCEISTSKISYSLIFQEEIMSCRNVFISFRIFLPADKWLFGWTISLRGEKALETDQIHMIRASRKFAVWTIPLGTVRSLRIRGKDIFKDFFILRMQVGIEVRLRVWTTTLYKLKLWHKLYVNCYM